MDFNLDNVCEKSKTVSVSEEKREKMKLSGDAIFNFSSKGRENSRFSMFDKHLDTIKDEELKNEYKAKLKCCGSKWRENEKFSLIPSVGRLQQAKQGIGNGTSLFVVCLIFLVSCCLIFQFSLS